MRFLRWLDLFLGRLLAPAFVRLFGPKVLSADDTMAAKESVFAVLTRVETGEKTTVGKEGRNA